MFGRVVITAGWGRRLVGTFGYGGLGPFVPPEPPGDTQWVEEKCQPATFTEEQCQPASYSEEQCAPAAWEELTGPFINLGATIEGTRIETRDLAGPPPGPVAIFAGPVIEGTRLEGPPVRRPGIPSIEGTRLEGSLRASFGAMIEGTRSEGVPPETITVVLANPIDNYIRGGANQDNNFGASSVLQVRSAGADVSVRRRGLIGFQNHGIPTGSTIVSARFDIALGVTYTSSDCEVTVQRLLRLFTEGTGTGSQTNDGATWIAVTYGPPRINWDAVGANFPEIDYSTTNQVPFTVRRDEVAGTVYPVDITDMVQDQISAGDSMLAYRLDQTANDRLVTFASDENGSHPSVTLTVTYIEPAAAEGP